MPFENSEVLMRRHSDDNRRKAGYQVRTSDAERKKRGSMLVASRLLFLLCGRTFHFPSFFLLLDTVCGAVPSFLSRGLQQRLTVAH
jgi:hypothetical protein